MSRLFPVSVNDEMFEEFIVEFETQHLAIEHLIIELETNPQDLIPIDFLCDIYRHLLRSSSKLNLTPISECFTDIILVFEVIVAFNHFPKQVTEFILLVSDFLILQIRGMINSHNLDIVMMQHILVSLQIIILTKKKEDLETNTDLAINEIARMPEYNIASLTDSDNGEVILFDEGLDSSTQKNTSKYSYIIPQFHENPLFQARHDIEDYLSDHPLNILASISDVALPRNDNHTGLLLELSLATNTLAGSPIAVEELIIGICLHDIGMAVIPDIGNKKGPLSKKELTNIRQHPIVGSELTTLINNGTEVSKNIVLHHHERINGSGYPLNLKGDSISCGGKLLAITDSFHAMIESKPYKKHPRSIIRAMSELNACGGSHYDKGLLQYFNKCISDYWMPDRKLKASKLACRTSVQLDAF